MKNLRSPLSQLQKQEQQQQQQQQLHRHKQQQTTTEIRTEPRIETTRRTEQPPPKEEEEEEVSEGPTFTGGRPGLNVARFTRAVVAARSVGAGRLEERTHVEGTLIIV